MPLIWSLVAVQQPQHSHPDLFAPSHFLLLGPQEAHRPTKRASPPVLGHSFGSPPAPHPAI